MRFKNGGLGSDPSLKIGWVGGLGDGGILSERLIYKTGALGKITKKRIFLKRGVFCSGSGRKHGVFRSDTDRKMGKGEGGFRATHTRTALIREYPLPG